MATESSLLSKLNSSDLSSIYHDFTSYLQPLDPFLKKQATSSKPADDSTSTVVCKKFIPFLEKSLPLILKRLNHTPKIDPSFASQLLKTYKLCLDCMEAVSSDVSCKPYFVEERVELIRCYRNWMSYQDALSEGLLVLDYFVKMLVSKLPVLREDNCDKKTARLILEVISIIANCIENNQSKEEEVYPRVILMVMNDIRLWLRSICANDQLHKLLESLKLCWKAAWDRVKQMCDDRSSSDLSDGAITTFAIETFNASTCLLSIVNEWADRCASEEMSIILISSLKCWFDARNTFEKIPIPLVLVKVWVQIQFKNNRHFDAGKKVVTIYDMIEFIFTTSKETVGTLLEQEHECYVEMASLNPMLSELMQETVLDTLLKKVYTTEDTRIRKFRILILKTQKLRQRGVGGRDDCVKYLTQAISLVHRVYVSDKDGCGEACNLLAKAYCLHAFLLHDAQPKSKHVVNFIDKALKLWSSHQEHSLSAEKACVYFQNTLPLLYHVCDLLSLKGYMEKVSGTYDMMIAFYKCKNVPLKEYLAILWKSRSLSHPLCISPIRDEFISQHCNSIESKSMEFWTSCMYNPKSLEVDFRQKILVISTLSSPDIQTHDPDIQPHTTIDEVKKAAFDLLENDPKSRESIFLAAHLYSDLAERMVAKGSMFEALSYAKEAVRLRVQLFNENFTYSTRKVSQIISDDGEIIPISGYELVSFDMLPIAAEMAWLNDADSSAFSFVLTPWNVLRSYLESYLQVGTILETVGDGLNAQEYLVFGKNVSCFLDLPIFIVSFSSAVANLYRKKRLWTLAKHELNCAKKMLDSGRRFSCSKCKLILEATVDQQSGDLAKSHFNTTFDNNPARLSEAANLYRSAVQKLKLPEWKNCVSNPKEASSRNTMFCDSVPIGEKDVSFSSDTGNLQDAIQPKLTEMRRITEEQRVASRITGSSKQKSENAQNEVQNVVDRKRHACDDGLSGKGIKKLKVDHIVACGCEVTCVPDEVNCWHCVPYKVVKSSSLKSIINTRWEYTRRRILLRLLSRIGRCLWDVGEAPKAYEIFLESISVLVNRSTFSPSNHLISPTFMETLVSKNVTGMFAIEHASLLYNICRFSLKRLELPKDMRVILLPKETIVSGLKLAFILCCEVPELFQKVSRMLALLYTLSSSKEELSWLTSSKGLLSGSQWASYFHQASLGTHLDHQMLPYLKKDLFLSMSTSLSLQRLAPESVQGLEKLVSQFFEGLPRATIVCISMPSHNQTSWLRDLLPSISPTAWIIFSRLNFECAPVVIVLPVDRIVYGRSKDDEFSTSGISLDQEIRDNPWTCPWDHAVIDEIAPLFRTILEGNHLSLRKSLMNTNEKMLSRQAWRKSLDERLCVLLRDVEDLLFGPWKHLLLGELSDPKHVDFLQNKLTEYFESGNRTDVQEKIVKAVTRGGVHATTQEKCLSALIRKKGCYFGVKECCDASLPSVSGFLNAMHNSGEEKKIDRKPLILVPNFDIQMIPWESFPILRDQTVFRMPSVGSISFAYHQCRRFLEKVGRDSAMFPMIDPLDAYYILNPSGEVSNVDKIEDWVKLNNFKGKSGTAPTINELREALTSHDLYLYFGHGSGAKYFPPKEIKKLEGCAAPILMGCSSAFLFSNGSYVPEGPPLHYLLAGSPVLIGNLWDIGSLDLSVITKALVDALKKARSTTKVDCAYCIKSKEEGGTSCEHRPVIASILREVRGACDHPYLTGAASVCYGVPTAIWSKNS